MQRFTGDSDPRVNEAAVVCLTLAGQETKRPRSRAARVVLVQRVSLIADYLF